MIRDGAARGERQGRERHVRQRHDGDLDHQCGWLVWTAFAGVTGAPFASETVQHAANGRAESATFGNGMTEAWSYNADGSYQAAYAAVTGKPYASDTVQYGANGRPESALFSNGMTEIWTHESDGSYEAAFAGVTGAAYTALQDEYNSSGELETSLTTNTNGTGTLRGHQDGLTLTATENRETLIGGGQTRPSRSPRPSATTRSAISPRT